jgi:hypothetical protein
VRAKEELPKTSELLRKMGRGLRFFWAALTEKEDIGSASGCVIRSP